MARRRTTKVKRGKPEKTPPRKRKIRKRPKRKEANYNPLLVLVVFLYMLGLIEKKTVVRIQAALSPKEKTARKRRRRRR